MTVHHTQTGNYHKTHDLPCQDAVFIAEDPHSVVIALADGASACAHSHTGAQIACREAAQFLCSYGELLDGAPDAKAAFLLLEQVCAALQQEACRSRIPLAEYGSTLLVCRIPKQGDTAVVYALGDGECCRIRDGICLSAVQAAPGIPGCPLTVTKNACKAMRIARVALRSEDAVFLCSDGTAELCADPVLGSALQAALSRKDFETIRWILQNTDPVDDCSFVAYSRG